MTSPAHTHTPHTGDLSPDSPAQVRFEAIVLDYSVLAGPPWGRRPCGAALATLLAEYGVHLPPTAQSRFDQALALADPAVHTTLQDLLRWLVDAYRLPTDMDPIVLADALLKQVGDVPVRPEAAQVVRVLLNGGWRVVVVSTTYRPHYQRAATLVSAGLARACAVTSSQTGCAPPDPRFYARVLEQAEAEPERTVWVGQENDLSGARRAGMHALVLRRSCARRHIPDALSCLTELTHLPAPAAAHAS